MSNFICFLRSECPAILAFIESGVNLDEDSMDLDAAIIKHVSDQPRLQEYFDAEDIYEQSSSNANESSNVAASWSRVVRLAIMEYLATFEINISLLMDVIEEDRFEAELEEVVEIIRALDILGADKRLSEYEAVLYLKLKKSKKDSKNWQKRFADKLPVIFLDRTRKYFPSYSTSRLFGIVGSQRLIEYFLRKDDNQLKHDEIFAEVCSNGHLSVAQWLLSTYDVNIHFWDDQPFRFACCNGHLSVVQWLHSLGRVNIHAEDDHAFRNAYCNGHLPVLHWLYSIGVFDIHTANDYAFRTTCSMGHLLVAQWFYSLGGDLNIHIYNDEAFRYACIHGHLSVAQWLHSLGEVNIHVYNDEAFRFACSRGHLSVAQWLHSLGDIDIHTSNDDAFRNACMGGHLPVVEWLYCQAGISLEVLQECYTAAEDIEQCQPREKYQINQVKSWLKSIMPV
jgi:hypothetical protein